MPGFQNRRLPRRLASLLLLFLLLPLLSVHGQEDVDPLPPVLATGFHAYRMGGPDEALRAWLRGSPLEGSHDAAMQEASLHAAQANLGPFRGFDVAATREVSASTRILYFTLDYEKGPIFAKFVLYRTDADWIVTNLLFDANDANVLPVP